MHPECQSLSNVLETVDAVSVLVDADVFGTSTRSAAAGGPAGVAGGDGTAEWHRPTGFSRGTDRTRNAASTGGGAADSAGTAMPSAPSSPHSQPAHRPHPWVSSSASLLLAPVLSQLGIPLATLSPTTIVVLLVVLVGSVLLALRAFYVRCVLGPPRIAPSPRRTRGRGPGSGSHSRWERTQRFYNSRASMRLSRMDPL